VARDVTEERRVTAELSARVTELADLNAELESFSYTVSHDLRAPLRHVAGFNGLIVRSGSPRLTDQERRWLAQSIEAAQRMGRLIDDLLAFSQTGRTPLNKQRVDLNEVVRAARQEAETADLEGRRIHWSIAPLPEVHGDAGMLRRVFANLIGNAVKYTRHQAYAAIDVGTLPEEDSKAVVYIRDNGVGFDPQYAHKLFGVFQRLHAQEEFDGTGIGLATVRRIIQRHGGRVWGEGVTGAGATFYVALPLIERERVA
jgi:light-regulated signal transduction histidine kinase (bacteriophytochrome)